MLRPAAGCAARLMATQQKVAGEREGRRPQSAPTHELETWSVAVLPTPKAKRKLKQSPPSPEGSQGGRSRAMLNSRNASDTPRGLTRPPRQPTPESQATHNRSNYS